MSKLATSNILMAKRKVEEPESSDDEGPVEVSNRRVLDPEFDDQVSLSSELGTKETTKEAVEAVKEEEAVKEILARTKKKKRRNKNHAHIIQSENEPVEDGEHPQFAYYKQTGMIMPVGQGKKTVFTDETDEKSEIVIANEPKKSQDPAKLSAEEFYSLYIDGEGLPQEEVKNI
eukprot:maker-scaffold_7-snap-gene-11.55-mRNA-1 protein AED:0.01 eAED:0.01 QI:72/1/1/1/0.5/0.33/3/1514/173